MADDTDANVHRWETEYERTWEAIQEDAEGSLQASIDHILHKAKRRRMLDKPSNVRLGMMRHLFLVVDMSQAMEDQDLKPSRLHCTLKLLEYFVEEYFDQNPISQLGIIVTRNKRAEKISELGGNPKRHVSLLRKLSEQKCQGEPSLQNSVELAASTLKHMPGHASREVLVVFGSLTTCDPGNISETVTNLKNLNIRVSMLGLAAEVRICKKLCHDTKGQYNVILDDHHLKELLHTHVTPPAAATNVESSLIKMGFPHHQLQPGKEDKAAMCMCHLDSKNSPGFSTTGYFCPQCRSKYCELPVECKVCGLTLVSAPHLARSYHHLFTLDPYREVDVSSTGDQPDRSCAACQDQIQGQAMYQCTHCDEVFCVDCDVFIHETLHSCPGCASNRATQDSTQGHSMGLS